MEKEVLFFEYRETDWCVERNSWFDYFNDYSYIGLGNEWKWLSNCLIDKVKKSMLIGSLSMIMYGRSKNTCM